MSGDTESIVDQKRFVQRLRQAKSNCDFHLHQTDCCRSIFVEDEEIMTAFYDPNDLSKTLLLEQGVACPLCGEAEWDYSEVTDTKLVPPAWAWACRL